MEAYNALYIRTPFGSRPKPRIFGEYFNPVHISKLVDTRLAYVRFHKGNEECHCDAEGVRGELKRGSIEVLKHCNEARMKQKRSSSLHDCLTEGHHAKRRKIRSLVRARLLDFLPQPKLVSISFTLFTEIRDNQSLHA